MTTWDEFAAAAPALAAAGTERFERTGLALVGSLRRDGYPRISPVEPLITGGWLQLGMMYRSTKALDLYRNPRCLVHSTVADKDGADGEFKVYGQARPVTDVAGRERYRAALFEKIGWRPEGDFDLFGVDIQQVAFVLFGGGKQAVRVWRPGKPVRELEKPA